MANFRFSTRELESKLRRELTRLPNRGRAAMTDVSHFLRGETQKRTPQLDGPLTQSVVGEVQPYRQSVAAVVKIPLNSPASSYAVERHEGFYNLGPISQAKNSGAEVGRKYITRAIDDNRGDIRAIIVDKMKVGI